MSSKANDLREISELKEQLAFYKSARERERYWEGRWRDEAVSNKEAADIIQGWQNLSDKQKEVVAELEVQLTECRRAHNSTLALFVAERERAEKAEGLLKPFAKFADKIPKSSPDALVIWWAHPFEIGIATALDFRLARAALQTKEGE